MRAECPSCGKPRTGRFCTHCGEKVLLAGDLSLRHYLGELVHGFTHADGKVLKTLRTLVAKPGELSLAYMEGRRRSYMKPVALFLVLNLVYFLFPLFETFNTSLNSQLHMQPYSGLARNMMESVLKRTGAEAAAFGAAYAAHSSPNAKLMLILMVFMLAPLFGLIYWRRTPYASGHVAFGFEAMAYNLLVPTIGLGILFFVLGDIVRHMGESARAIYNDGVIGLIAVALNLWFFYQAGRRFHRCTGLGSAWRALLAVGALVIALNAYRFILFVVTTWQVNGELGH